MFVNKGLLIKLSKVSADKKNVYKRYKVIKFY